MSSSIARRLVSFATALALGTCDTGAAPRPLADVPMLSEIVAISVVADIGTHRGVHCILDTGSSAGILHSDLTVGAEPVGHAKTQVANGTVVMPIVQIRTVAVGTADVSLVEFMQRDHSWFHANQRLPCVIGANFMKHFTVDFDGAAGRVRLYPQGTRIDDILGMSPPAGIHLDARISNGIHLDTSVGTIRTQSEVDTGWGYATPNRALLDALGFTPGDTRIHAETRSGFADAPVNLQLSEIAKVRIGAVLADKLKISVGEADMSHIAMHRDPYLHIGSDFVRQHRLLIDYAHADVALIP